MTVETRSVNLENVIFKKRSSCHLRERANLIHVTIVRIEGIIFQKYVKREMQK